jgi:hypothetical protein
VQSQTEESIAVILAIDLVAMTKVDLLAPYLQNGAPFMYLRLQLFAKEAIEVEIVVPLEVDDPHAAPPHPLQALYNFPIVAVDGARVADPEFEQVTQNIQGVRVRWKSLQKTDQDPIVGIFGTSQVCIGDEYLAHLGNIYKNGAKVKKEKQDLLAP